MKKLLTAAMIGSALLLSGCGVGASIDASVTGESYHCVEGVKYVQFRNGASVMYNPDGTVKTCS